MPGLRDLPGGDCVQHSAAGLLEMRAILKPALADIRLKLPERILQRFAPDRLDEIYLKRSKAGRIRDIGVISEVIQLNMTRRMTAAPKLIAYRL